ncbi:MAG: LysR substrate-binding domain-containing protein, partial [Betaproteobacteria bacterium]|nr:LysR substrate-binding domain-containing protein [Betaproteobacteria bacterium]
TDDVVFKSILRDPFVCVCPHNHVLASRREVRLAELVGFPFLIFASGNVRTILQKAFEKKGVPLRPAYEVVHHYTLGGMVEAGLGITALPSIAISMLNRSLLRTVRIVDPEITREVGVLHRRDQLPTPAVDAFLSVLDARLKRLQAGGGAPIREGAGARNRR